MMDWKFYWDAYTGSGGFEDGSYLVRYPRETDEKFNRRRQLAVYPNFVKKVVETFVNTVFSSPPQRFDLPQEYLNFAQDTDRLGTHIDDFMRNLLRLSLIYGTVFLVVDKPSGKARTRQEEIDRKLFPYAVVITPDRVQSVELDDFGRLTKLTLKEKESYLTFMRDGWIRSKDRFSQTVIEAGQTGFMQVLAVSWRQRLTPDEVFIKPFIHDIAHINRDLYNALSELREIIRATTFPVFTLPVKDLQSLEELQRQGLTIGTENVITFNPEAGGKPDYIAPPPEPAKVYMDYIQRLVELIYQSVNLEFVLGVKQEKSGVALEFEFQDLNRMLAGFASTVEKVEYEIASKVMAWYGKEFKGTITYRKDFSFRDVEKRLRLAYDALALNVSPTFQQELHKEIVRLMLPELPDNTYERIDAEIEGLEGLDNQLKNEVKFLESQG